MALNVGTIRGFLELEDNFSPKLQQAGRLVAQSGDKWTKSGADMQRAGARMTLGITAPIVAAGGAALKFATDFNAGMANVATLIPGNADRVNELTREVQDLAIETGKSTSDLADGLYQTVSAFGDSAESADILGINARAAAAGVATTTDAINLTSAVTKGYGDTSAAAVGKVADLAFQAVKLGQTTFPELAASIGRVTPLTAELGVSQEELFGTMATFTGVTGNAAEVSTQLRGVMQGLISPSDTMKDLFGAIGVESGKALIEQRGLSGAIETVVAAANAGDKDLADYIGSIEGQTLALAATGSQSDTYAEKLGAMTMAAGAADEAFREQTEGVNAAGFSWQQFQQRLAVAAQQLGDVLLPTASRFLENVAIPLLEWVTSAVEWFGNLPEPVQTVGVAIAGIAAAAGPVLVAVGTLVSSFGAVASVVGPLITSLGGAGLGGAIASVSTGLLGPAGLVAGVGAASYAMGSWINENIIGTQALADFGEWLGIAEPAVQLTAEELANMRDRQTETNAAVTAGAGAVAAIVDPTTAAGVAAAETARRYALLPPGFDNSGAAAGRARPVIDDLNRSLYGIKTNAEIAAASLEEMLGPFEDLTEVATEFSMGPPANVPPLIDTLDRSMERLERATGAANKPLGSFFGSFETGIGFIDDALGSLGGFVKDGLGGLLGGLGEVGGAIAGMFGGKGGGGGILGAIGGLFGGGGGGGGSLFGGLFSSIKGMFSGGQGEQVLNIAATNAAGILSGGLASAGTEAAGGFLGGLSGILGSVSSFLPIVGPLLSAFGGPLLDGLKALGGKIWSGLKGLFGGPSGDELEARDIVGSVNDAMTGLLDSQQRLEAGGERWKLQNVAQRDIIMALGGSVADVEATWRKFSEAQKSTEGAAAFEAFFSEKLERVKAAMDTTGLGLTELRDLAINSANVMQVSVSEAFGLIAEGTITSMADAHAAAAEAMANTAADAAGAVAETQQAATKAVEETASFAAAAAGAAADEATRRAKEAQEAIVNQARVTEEAARRIAGIDINIPVRFDVEDLDLGDLELGGRGGEGERKRERGFAGGTDFDFLRFGKGTSTTLHGDEAVVTRGQGLNLARMVTAAARAGAGASSMGGGGGGGMVVKVMLPNGKVLAETVLDEMPRMLSHRGVNRRN